MLDVTPQKYMKRNETSRRHGSGMVTMKIDRKCARNKKVDQCHQDEFFDQRVFKGVRCAVYKLCAVIKGNDLHARRETGV